MLVSPRMNTVSTVGKQKGEVRIENISECTFGSNQKILLNLLQLPYRHDPYVSSPRRRRRHRIPFSVPGSRSFPSLLTSPAPFLPLHTPPSPSPVTPSNAPYVHPHAWRHLKSSRRDVRHDLRQTWNSHSIEILPGGAEGLEKCVGVSNDPLCSDSWELFR